MRKKLAIVYLMRKQKQAGNQVSRLFAAISSANFSA
ncbi:hypothetical protein CF65_00895 [Aggregatibacter actinomycetemcomitans HK1651]|nr:hypothetical protein CF65_00895 [Aggregatibacter actinomycetemcomitans HK1651]